MKIPASKIELAASQQASRYMLQAVNLDIQTQQLMATDGHILAVVSAEVSPDGRGRIHSPLLAPKEIIGP